LAKALSNLRSKKRGPNDIDGESKEGGKPEGAKTLEVEAFEEGTKPARRTRSGSIMLFEPQSEEGHMPSISVDDFSDSSEHGGSVPQSPISPIAETTVTTFHTSRPPVELIHAA